MLLLQILWPKGHCYHSPCTKAALAVPESVCLQDFKCCCSTCACCVQKVTDPTALMQTLQLGELQAEAGFPSAVAAHIVNNGCCP